MSETTTDTFIENANSVGRLIAKDIVNVTYKGDITLEPEDFKSGLETYTELAQGKKLKVLVEIGKYSTASPEARKFASENNPELFAEAIVIHGLAQRILAKFYIIFHHYDHPIRIFDDKELAIKWLKSL